MRTKEFCKWMNNKHVQSFGPRFSLAILGQIQDIHQAIIKETDSKIKKEAREYIETLKEIADTNSQQCDGVINIFEKLLEEGK